MVEPQAQTASQAQAEALTPLSTWKQRFDILELIMQELEGEMPLGFDAEQVNVHLDWIKAIVRRMHVFCVSHFDFFYRYFLDTPEAEFHSPSAADLDPRTHYSREYLRSDIQDNVFDSLIYRMANDIAVMEALLSQRRSALTRPHAARHIQIADLLARASLAAFNQNLDAVKKNTVFTYRRPAPTARVLPYADAVVIGVPMTSMYIFKDLLAIPHEVGHYLYWNARNTAGDTLADVLTEATRDIEYAVRRWQEEVFADVVSCLIGGPVVALSFLELSKTYVGDQFLNDNGTHPIPAIRPYIYTYLLSNGAEFPDTDQPPQRSLPFPLWPGDKVNEFRERAIELQEKWNVYALRHQQAAQTDAATIDGPPTSRGIPLTYKQVRNEPSTSAGPIPGAAMPAPLDSLPGTTFEHTNDYLPHLRVMIDAVIHCLVDFFPDRFDVTRPLTSALIWSDGTGSFARWYEDFDSQLRDTSLLRRLSEHLPTQPSISSDDAPIAPWEEIIRDKLYKGSAEQLVHQYGDAWRKSNWVRIYRFNGWTDGPAGHGKAHQ